MSCSQAVTVLAIQHGNRHGPYAAWDRRDGDAPFGDGFVVHISDDAIALRRGCVLDARLMPTSIDDSAFADVIGAKKMRRPMAAITRSACR